MIARAFCLFLALGLGAPALAQSGRRPAPPPGSPDDEVRLEADEVRLSVRVHDAAGRPVGGLEREDFIVAERGERQTLVSFAAEKAPLDLVLVLDASPDVYGDLGAPPKGDRPVPRVQQPSIVDKILGPPPQPPAIRIDRLADLAFARRVARELVGRLRPGDRVSVLQVSDKVELLQDWTDSREDAVLAVNWRFRLSSGSAVWDALYLAAEEKLAAAAGRRVVVFVGDGVDTASRLTSAEAAAALDRLGASLYVVSPAEAARAAAEHYVRAEGRVLAPRRRQAERAVEALALAESEVRALTERSGGAFYPLRSEADAAAIPSAMFEALGGSYSMSYVPNDPARDGGWRPIAVFTDRPGCTAVTRKGYYRN